MDTSILFGTVLIRSHRTRTASGMMSLTDWGDAMQKPDKLNFAGLFGFETVSNKLSSGLDFQDDSIAAKLGAKVGDGESSGAPAEKKAIQFSKLLGFEVVAEELSKDLNFQDETMGDKLGAKIGPPEPVSPGASVDFKGDTLSAKLGAKVGAAED